MVYVFLTMLGLVLLLILTVLTIKYGTTIIRAALKVGGIKLGIFKGAPLRLLVGLAIIIGGSFLLWRLFTQPPSWVKATASKVGVTFTNVLGEIHHAVWAEPMREVHDDRRTERLRQESSFDSAGLQRYGYIVPFRHDGSLFLNNDRVCPVREVAIHQWDANGASLYKASTTKLGSYTYSWDGSTWGVCHYKANPSGDKNHDGSSLWKKVSTNTDVDQTTSGLPISIKAAQWAGPTGIIETALKEASSVNKRGKGETVVGAFAYTTVDSTNRATKENTGIYVLVETRRPNP